MVLAETFAESAQDPEVSMAAPVFKRNMAIFNHFVVGTLRKRTVDKYNPSCAPLIGLVSKYLGLTKRNFEE